MLIRVIAKAVIVTVQPVAAVSVVVPLAVDARAAVSGTFHLDLGLDKREDGSSNHSVGVNVK